MKINNFLNQKESHKKIPKNLKIVLSLFSALILSGCVDKPNSITESDDGIVIEHYNGFDIKKGKKNVLILNDQNIHISPSGGKYFDFIDIYDKNGKIARLNSGCDIEFNLDSIKTK